MDFKKVDFIYYQYKNINFSCEERIQSSIVCIVTRLWAGQFWVWIVVSARDFFPSPECPDWLFGPTVLLFTAVPRFFLVVKQPGREVNHSPPSGAEVKNEWCYTSPPLYVFMQWARKILPYYLFSKSCVVLFFCLTLTAEVLYLLAVLILFHSTRKKEGSLWLVKHHTKNDVLWQGSRVLVLTFGIWWRCVSCITCPIHVFGIIFSLYEWMGAKCRNVSGSSLFNQQNVFGNKLIFIIAVCLLLYWIWLGNKDGEATM